MSSSKRSFTEDIIDRLREIYDQSNIDQLDTNNKNREFLIAQLVSTVILDMINKLIFASKLHISYLVYEISSSDFNMPIEKDFSNDKFNFTISSGKSMIIYKQLKWFITINSASIITDYLNNNGFTALAGFYPNNGVTNNFIFFISFQDKKINSIVSSDEYNEYLNQFIKLDSIYTDPLRSTDSYSSIMNIIQNTNLSCKM